jgi:hypothetical protein
MSQDIVPHIKTLQCSSLLAVLASDQMSCCQCYSSAQDHTLQPLLLLLLPVTAPMLTHCMLLLLVLLLLLLLLLMLLLALTKTGSYAVPESWELPEGWDVEKNAWMSGTIQAAAIVLTILLLCCPL